MPSHEHNKCERKEREKKKRAKSETNKLPGSREEEQMPTDTQAHMTHAFTGRMLFSDEL